MRDTFDALCNKSSSHYFVFLFIATKKKTVAISILVFCSEPCHTQLSPLFQPPPPPHNSGHPFAAVWMHYLETSIAHAFQDGVRLLSCHVALTRVHDRFQPPSATNPSPLKSTPILRRLSMVQDYVHLPREIYFSVSVTLLPLSNPIDYNFYSLKLPKHFNDCNNDTMTVTVLRRRLRLLPCTNPH